MNTVKNVLSGPLNRSIRFGLASSIIVLGAVGSSASAQEAATRANALDSSIFQSVATCALLAPELIEDTQPIPAYVSEAAGCTVVPDVQNAASGTLFSDAACEQGFSYVSTNLIDYCGVAMDKTLLGNASDIGDVAGRFWTLPAGTQFDVGALSLAELNQPFMARAKYKSVQTAGGTCDLEMRIYKQNPEAEGLKSLIALHGGSWTSRGFGFFGTEMTVPQYTSEGFVVFAPFYRLLDSKEGNPACHNATISQITQDADDALQWVIDNAESWGANDFPVVFGQSAGAHLAASLAVNNPEQVASAILFYPPTDFTDFALEVQNGNYVNEQGLDILERVIGGSFDSVNLSSSQIVENSFPAIVEANPDRYPPMFMLHGLDDDLVEARQSIRLCGALSGSAESTFDIAALESASDLRQTEDCDDRGSAMHLIKEGGHALDVCLVDFVFVTDACPSGSSASVAVVADSISESVSWASEILDQEIALLNAGNGTDGTTTDGNTTDGGVASGSSGGGGALGWSLGFIAMLSLVRRRFSRAFCKRL